MAQYFDLDQRFPAQKSSGSSISACIVALSVVLLAACAVEEPSVYLRYASKLANVLEEPLEQPLERPLEQPLLESGNGQSNTAGLLYPRPRQLQHTFVEFDVDVFDYLKLGDCALQSLIAERNSSLGRLAGPSQRLIYEVRFLAQAEVCVKQLAGDSAGLADKLTGIVQVKKGELAAHIWQATIGGEEFSSFWHTPLVVEDEVVPVDPEIQLALTQLGQDIDRWLAGDYQISAERLEQQLGLIRRGRGGHFIAAWSALAEGLPIATEVLAQRLARKPLCFPGMNTPKANVFRNVVFSAFIGDIQKQTSVLGRATTDILVPVEIIEQLLSSAELPAFGAWRESRQLIVRRGQASVLDHVRALQPFMDQCGFMPRQGAGGQ